jgi:hypothetical protein
VNDACQNRPDLPRRVPGRTTDAVSSAAQRAALERLAAALGTRDFATTLTTGQGRAPCLTVASRRTRLTEDIYVSRLGYWWSWAERIGGLDDPLAAAQKVATVLRTAPEPSHG